jgi:hypothetical protein
MTRDKDRKRIIRRRMKKTGESYTAARARILARARSTPQPARDADPAARAGISQERITARTGRTWREWVRLLDADGAASLAHRDIAALVHRKYGVGDWWAQTVTVGYERIKGLREINQRRSGEYEAGRSKTVNVPVEVLFDAVVNATTRRRWLDGIDARLRTATRAKSARLHWPDGTIVVVGFTSKGAAKSSLSIQHTRLRDKAALERAKQYWSGRLAALGSMLAGAEA